MTKESEFRQQGKEEEILWDETGIISSEIIK
jgi:hypothetical protein